MLDIKITNAKTRKTGKELVEIGIENGKITAIASSVEGGVDMEKSQWSKVSDLHPISPITRR